MTERAPLFDLFLLARRTPRAARLAHARAGADFLLAQAREDLALRVAAVSRPFPRAVDLFSPSAGAWPVITTPDRMAVTAGLPWHDGRAHLRASFAALPFADSSLDLVVSLLALQYCEDLPGLLAQVRRALRPDGLFLACLVGGRSLQELRTAFAQAEAETVGGVSPHVIPFVDVREAGALLQRAGFALPVADVDTLVVRYRSVFDLIADLRAMGATNVLHERSRKPLRRSTLFRAAEIYAESFADPDGKLRATFDLVWLSGWAPHESQQKPLAPGSAKRSLAAALGVTEGVPTRRQDD